MTVSHDPPFTHFSYLVSTKGWNEPTELYNLTAATPKEIHDLQKRLSKGKTGMDGGELLGRVPLNTTVECMGTLRNLLLWIHENPDRAKPPEDVNESDHNQ